MAKFPFPSRELALEEIKNDVMYKKMTRHGVDADAAMEKAWQTGVRAAEEFYKEMRGEKDFRVISEKKGMKVKRVPRDNVVAGMRIFAEYESGTKTMDLYTGSIEKWAAKNKLSVSEAENLIMSHEFFHHLEHTQLGLTSKQVELPVIDVFGLKIGKTGVRALSEAGAHAFARTYYELCENSKKPNRNKVPTK